MSVAGRAAQVDGEQDEGRDEDVQAVPDEMVDRHRDDREDGSQSDDRSNDERAERDGDEQVLAGSAPHERQNAEGEQRRRPEVPARMIPMSGSE